MQRKNLAEFLDFINNNQSISLGIDSWRHLVDYIPRKHSPIIITVAGTNGKGSFVEIFSKALSLKGFSYASYTSPHISDFRERLNVNGFLLSESEWLQAFFWVQDISEGVILSPFEFYTLAALYLAYSVKIDYLLLEVGMGGRLDAVNVVDPDFSVITEIDYDHTEFLGSDLESIAYEKSGIMRYGKPVVYSGNNVRSVIEKLAKKNGAKLYMREFIPNELPLGLALPSAVAAMNLAEIFPFDLSNEVQESIKSFRLPGRFSQVEYNGCRMIFDVAHNASAINSLVCNIKKMNFSKVCVWLSLGKAKDAIGCVNFLREVADVVCVSSYSESLAHNCSYVRDLLVSAGVDVINQDFHYDKPQDIIEVYKKSGCDVLVVTGSFYHVGMVKDSMNINFGAAP